MNTERNEEVQYIWHDGVRIREEQLISMAMSAGSYTIAEHYMCSLLAHGVIYDRAYLIDKVNEIRECYQVRQLPVPNKDDSTGSGYRKSINDQIRKMYQRMIVEERIELLRAALEAMMANSPGLFVRKKQWQGIYLVVRDRLEGAMNGTKFVPFIDKATPAGWPKALRVSAGSIRNMSRDMHSTDFLLMAYYELDYNPYEELCNRFWEVVKEVMMGLNDAEMKQKQLF